MLPLFDPAVSSGYVTVTTFTNPAPAPKDAWSGSSLAAAEKSLSPTTGAAAALGARTRGKTNVGGIGALDALELMTSTVPEQAALMRERFWRDAKFRLVCEEYHEASEALGHLERTHSPTDAPA